MNKTLLKIFAQALHTGQETSMSKLMKANNQQDLPILEQIANIDQLISDFALCLIPDLKHGDIESTRILQSSEKVEYSEETIRIEIHEGEYESQEFKSSLMYDHQKISAQPGLGIQEYKSEEVIHSTLKTVGALLCCGGGILFLGVNDGGNCIGIESDYCFLKNGKGTRDDWELTFRNLIQSRFKDGNVINDYVGISFIEIDGKTIARVIVLKRGALSFLKRNGKYLLYRRQGNRTVEIGIEEIEEFLDFRIGKEWNI